MIILFIHLLTAAAKLLGPRCVEEIRHHLDTRNAAIEASARRSHQRPPEMLPFDYTSCIANA